jgi:uncharacterized membrane protein
MESERVQAIVLAAFFALPPILISVLLIPLLSRAATGRLERNQWVGIRTPSTMRSDQAWVAGHRAALRLTPLYLLTTAVTCVALIAAAVYASTTNAVVLAGFGGFAAVLAVLIYSAIVAGKAAKSADDRPDDRQRH